MRPKSQECQWQTDNSQIPTLQRNPSTLRVWAIMPHVFLIWTFNSPKTYPFTDFVHHCISLFCILSLHTAVSQWMTSHASVRWEFIVQRTEILSNGETEHLSKDEKHNSVWLASVSIKKLNINKLGCLTFWNTYLSFKLFREHISWEMLWYST